MSNAEIEDINARNYNIIKNLRGLSSKYTSYDF